MLASRHDDLVDAARAGDEAAFAEVIDPHRGWLHAHCRRMLGTAEDADDAVQETLVRAWRGLSAVADARALGPWLRRIATNVSLNAIDKRRRSPVIAEAVEPDHAAAWDSAAALYERHEALQRALTAAFRHLPARQRAALILTDALGFSARESAAVLDTTPAAVNSALQRARASIDDGLPGPAADGGDDVERLAAALEGGDVWAVVAALSG